MSDDRRDGESLREAATLVRRAVLGDAHVDRATAATTDLDARFQRFITDAVWGMVWSDDGLDRRTRSLITVAILAALGRRDELALHLRGSRNTGATIDEIRETLMHVAVYAGVPAAHSAMTVAKQVLASGDPGPDETPKAPEPGGQSR
jgi:4-carboxymuconolactone decarboxylase